MSYKVLLVDEWLNFDLFRSEPILGKALELLIHIVYLVPTSTLPAFLLHEVCNSHVQAVEYLEILLLSFLPDIFDGLVSQFS